ncbi:MAG: class I SAM-dependent methyltransferase [Verrucomicrobiae bacterium]|nr:class I SAM-dependent methyltransferase [Verrucomicrobiae bacterium]
MSPLQRSNMCSSGGDCSAPPTDFEFDTLREAQNYRLAILNEFTAVLGGRVLEVGAGIGQMTALLSRQPRIEELVAVEPNPGYSALLKQACPRVEVHTGTVRTLPKGPPWDAIVSVNVLEHIPDDETELAIYASILKSPGGRLCLFVPAGPKIYAPIDRDFGHYRRYRKAELCQKLERAGFATDVIHYFNGVGYLLWWFNFLVLRKRRFSRSAVRVFDRLVFPLVYRIESTAFRPPIGQSVVAIGLRRG